jgi:hypothetical protein
MGNSPVMALNIQKLVRTHFKQFLNFKKTYIDTE